MADYITADTDGHYKAAAALFKEYAAWLNIDLNFQHFEKELQQLKEMYSPPEGGIILCKKENNFIASVAVRKINNEVAELKRMYVQPLYQHQGIGKALLKKAIGLSKDGGYDFIRLDTLNYMKPAINLYKKYGFYKIEAYYYNPNTDAIYFEKTL